jgi:hypothetical protein
MTEVTPQVVNPLRLSACIDCGYSLQGLPDAGACPECGTAYDQETVVLHGWARGSHANIGNASPRIVLWISLPLALFVTVNVMQFRALHRAPWPLLIPVVMVGLLLWRRWTSSSPTVLQVHFNRAGCVEIDRTALHVREEFTPWTKLDRIEIDPLDGDRHRLRIGKHPNWFGLAPRLTVDAEVQCTPEQAAALRARIDGWRADAEAARQTGGFTVVQKS